MIQVTVMKIINIVGKIRNYIPKLIQLLRIINCSLIKVVNFILLLRMMLNLKILISVKEIIFLMTIANVLQKKMNRKQQSMSLIAINHVINKIWKLGKLLVKKSSAWRANSPIINIVRAWKNLSINTKNNQKTIAISE